MGEVRVSGFSLPRKWPIDDETVAKAGHPVVVVRFDVGHPSVTKILQSHVNSIAMRAQLKAGSVI
jgi:hypothetical protein